MGTEGLACSNSALNGKWPQLGTGDLQSLARCLPLREIFVTWEHQRKALPTLSRAPERCMWAMREIVPGRDERPGLSYAQAKGRGSFTEVLLDYCH